MRRVIPRVASIILAVVACCILSVSPTRSAELATPREDYGSDERLKKPSPAPASTVEEEASIAAAAVYYASPGGGGSGTSVSSPFQIADFWAVARPGDTLFLLDGRYTGARSMIRPPEGLSGTAGSPITIKALNDGKVEIDGQRQYATVGLYLNDWFVLEGFNAHSPGSSSSSSVSVVSISYANNNIVRRVVAWDATDGNTNIFGAHHGNNNLFEDCAGFGIARKTFSSSQDGNNTTFRRIWARWEGAHAQGPKKAISIGYNNVGALVENAILTWDSIQMQESYTLLDYYGNEIGPDYTNYEVQMADGIVSHDGYDPPYPNFANARIVGSLIYLKNDQRYHNSFRWWNGPFMLQMPGIWVENSIAVIEPGTHDAIRIGQFGDGASGQNGLRDVTLAGGSAPSIGSSWAQQNILRQQDCRSLTANSGYVLDPSVSGISGGATLMKRYRDGVQTNEDLWPWPMNDRILDATTRFSSKPANVTEEVFGLCGGTMPANLQTGGSSDNTAFDEAVQAARNWLAANPSQRAQYESTLAAYAGDIDAVMEELRPKGSETATGEFYDATFQDPELALKHADHTFHYYVPPGYNPASPAGLYIWMHGGGGYEPGEHSGRRWLITNKQPEISQGNYIFVAPVAPHSQNLPQGLPNAHASRWNVPEAETYLRDIIKEFEQRYNIDQNRVILGGFSMGGIGAYHQVLRMSDRISAAYASAGSWDYSQWRVTVNTPFFIHHAVDDSYWNSPSDYRWHGTDVQKARAADEVLTALGIDHHYEETPGGHLSNPYADQAEVMFYGGQTGWAVGRPRDPYASRVIAFTRSGNYQQAGNFGVTWTEKPSLDQRWVQITGYQPGFVTVDRLDVQFGGSYASYDGWADYSATPATSTFSQAAQVDVRNLGNNSFEATTANVSSFSLWLHPRMIDTNQAITVRVNGVAMSGVCNPSLVDALRNFERTRDWGLVYQCEVTLRAQSETTTDVTQNIQLSEGWNVISLYVAPADSQIDNILASITDQVVLVKDEDGNVFSPSFGINGIGAWNPDEGYQINMASQATLSVSGQPVDPGRTIPLALGWNMAAFPFDTPRPVEIAFSSLDSELFMVKNNDGEIYSPSFGVNTIGNLEPGQGYFVYSSSSTGFIYGQ